MSFTRPVKLLPPILSSYNYIFLHFSLSLCPKTETLLFSSSMSLMARFLSKCGIRPLSRIFLRPRNPTKDRLMLLCKSGLHGRTFLNRPWICISSGSRRRDWTVKVSSPLRVASADGDDKEAERINGVNGVGDEDEFDPGVPPSFRLAVIRVAIPKHCWVKDPWRSLSYVVRDVVADFGLAAAAVFLNNWVVWPFIGLHRGPCSGLSLFLVMISNHIPALELRISLHLVLNLDTHESFCWVPFVQRPWKLFHQSKVE